MSTAPDNSQPEIASAPNSLGELAAVFLRLGATAFGGPLAHIALMRQEFVVRRQWLTDQEFLDLNGAVNLIPGPNSTELAMHIGHRRAGLRGLCVAGACFILPAMLMVLVLATLYARYGTLPKSQAVLHGLGPVVLAVIAQALYGFAPSALKNLPGRLLALFAVALLLWGWSEVGVILTAAAVGLAWAAFLSRSAAGPRENSSLASRRAQREKLRQERRAESERLERFAREWEDATTADTSELPASQPDRPKNTSGTDNHGSMPLLFVLSPVVAPQLAAIFWNFAKIGCLIYGSGYVLVAYLRTEFVERLKWSTETQLLDALAVGQVTPGPVFTTATFLGYQMGGLAGGVAATAGIFGPSFIAVALLSSFLDRFTKSPEMRVFLDCVNAASFALMAAVTAQLGYGMLNRPGGLMSAAIFLVCLGLLLDKRVSPTWLLVGGAAVGFAGLIS